MKEWEVTDDRRFVKNGVCKKSCLHHEFEIEERLKIDEKEEMYMQWIPLFIITGFFLENQAISSCKNETVRSGREWKTKKQISFNL